MKNAVTASLRCVSARVKEVFRIADVTAMAVTAGPFSEELELQGKMS